jgi:L-aspartate oxidase
LSTLRTDYLVIGSGIAGLTFALKTALSAPEAAVTIITKNGIAESNTLYAQGGLAVVTEEDDSFDKHIQDTVNAGDGLCDLEVVRIVVEEGPARVMELMEWGACFDENADKTLHLGREGGHGVNRIVHRADFTGQEIEQTLVKKVRQQNNINVLEYHFAIDLSKCDGRCTGALVLDSKESRIRTISAVTTVIASGGLGQIYKYTTNPGVATGDGIAMAARAGAVISNMEFIQFHPTALYNEQERPLFLISEAVRGAGAHLRNTHGERFMCNYDVRMELAFRDVVSRAIQSEMQKSGSPHLWLDCRHLDQAEFKKHFPTIHKKSSAMGLDPANDMLPVVPAAHYCCGGITTDVFGQTSIKGLYALGEVACTGLHGANRLASNSLPEALVFAVRASAHARNKKIQALTDREHESTNVKTKISEAQISKYKNYLQELTSSISVVTTDANLLNALTKINLLRDRWTFDMDAISSELIELNNMICVAQLIIEASLKRTTNRGTFYKIGGVTPGIVI